MTNKELKLVYVLPLEGNTISPTDGLYHYKLFLSSTPDDVWGIDWDIDNISSTYEDIEDSVPDPSTYERILEISSAYPLKTIEETSCYSMEYATYGLIALSWIDIDRMDVYPEQGRMVLHFGETSEKLKEIFEIFGINHEKF